MRWLVAFFWIGVASTQAQVTSGPWTYIDYAWTNYVIIVGYNGPGGTVVIPSELDGKLVRNVESFDDGYGLENTHITSVIIPEGVEGIGSLFINFRNLTNVTMPNSLKYIGGQAFYQCASLTEINIPNSVIAIGSEAFAGCTSLTNIVLPLRFLDDYNNLAIEGDVAAASMIQSIASALASNTNFVTAVSANNSFVTALANNDAFVTAVANKIKETSGNYGIATQNGLSNTLTTLASKTELTNALAESRADGINSVISNPNLWTLYTTNQIKAMVMGDLMLTRTNNGQFVLNYDIEQSDNLTTWAPYQGYALPLTNLPTDKAFVRIKLKNQQ